MYQMMNSNNSFDSSIRMSNKYEALVRQQLQKESVDGNSLHCPSDQMYSCRGISSSLNSHYKSDSFYGYHSSSSSVNEGLTDAKNAQVTSLHRPNPQSNTGSTSKYLCASHHSDPLASSEQEDVVDKEVSTACFKSQEQNGSLLSELEKVNQSFDKSETGTYSVNKRDTSMRNGSQFLSSAPLLTSDSSQTLAPQSTGVDVSVPRSHNRYWYSESKGGINSKSDQRLAVREDFQYHDPDVGTPNPVDWTNRKQSYRVHEDGRDTSPNDLRTYSPATGLDSDRLVDRYTSSLQGMASEYCVDSMISEQVDTLRREKEILAAEVVRLRDQIAELSGCDQGHTSASIHTYQPNNPQTLLRKIADLESQVQDLQEANECAMMKLAAAEKRIAVLTEKTKREDKYELSPGSLEQDFHRLQDRSGKLPQHWASRGKTRSSSQQGFSWSTGRTRSEDSGLNRIGLMPHKFDGGMESEESQVQSSKCESNVISRQEVSHAYYDNIFQTNSNIRTQRGITPSFSHSQRSENQTDYDHLPEVPVSRSLLRTSGTGLLPGDDKLNTSSLSDSTVALVDLSKMSVQTWSSHEPVRRHRTTTNHTKGVFEQTRNEKYCDDDEDDTCELSDTGTDVLLSDMPMSFPLAPSPPPFHPHAHSMKHRLPPTHSPQDRQPSAQNPPHQHGSRKAAQTDKAKGTVFKYRSRSLDLLSGRGQRVRSPSPTDFSYLERSAVSSSQPEDKPTESTADIQLGHNPHVRPTHRSALMNSCVGLKPFVPRTPNDIQVEDIVKFSRQGGKISRGAVKFVGHLPGRSEMYLGLELEKEEGKHDGVFDGVRYFKCKPNKAVFVAFNKVVMAWANHHRNPPGLE